jgi:hypothetical protein
MERPGLPRCRDQLRTTVNRFMPKSEPISSLLEKIEYLLSLRFLFRPFAAKKAEHTRECADTHEAGSESHRSNGISLKNGGIQRTL